MRRRRRSRGTWFPVLGTIPDEDEPISPLRLKLAVPAADGYGQRPTGVVPLTFDRPQEGDQLSPTADTLVEVIGNEYVLKRIVGKVYASHFGSASAASASSPSSFVTSFPALLVSCGFFVARAQDEDDPGGADLPIGTTGNSAINTQKIYENYSPLSIDTIREPWIWRRTWILGNPAIRQAFVTAAQTVSNGATVLAGDVYDYPATTAGYGSVMDGPHLDTKVKRRVGQDDRLWFAFSACPLLDHDAIFDTPANGSSLDITLDYRIFGSLRKAKNSSAF